MNPSPGIGLSAALGLIQLPNGFESHGIDHTSASSLNAWADAPCYWITQYLFKHRGRFSPAAKAGVVVEDAVVNVLARGWTAESAIQAAQDEYRKFTAIGATDADLKRGEGIPAMITLALNELLPYGEPEFAKDGITGNIQQKKVEVTCNGDGFTIPIIGYIDLHFPKVDTIVDLKTTGKMPSKMSPPHLRQRAIYKKAFGNQEVKFLYVTPKKAEFMCPDGYMDTLADIKTILNRQEKFLRLGDKEILRSIVPVNAESFYWGGNEALRKEMYGI